MARQNVQERIGRKTGTRQHKTAPKHRRERIFEEDCDAANQPRASKINDSANTAYQRVFGRNPPQVEDAILECGGADLGVVSRQQAGELAQERSMTVRRLCPPSKFSRGPQTSLGNEPCNTLRNTTRANCMLDNPSGFGDVERMQPRNQQKLSGTRAWSSATRWPQFGSPTEVP